MHVRFLLPKTDIVGKILERFANECEGTLFLLIDGALDEAQRVRSHNNRAKKTKKEEPSNTSVFAVWEPFDDLSLEMFGDHSERRRTNIKRVQNNIQNLLTFFQKMLHILLHISLRFGWIDFVQLWIIFDDGLNERFKDRIQITLPQNTSKSSH